MEFWVTCGAIAFVIIAILAFVTHCEGCWEFPTRDKCWSCSKVKRYKAAVFCAKCGYKHGSKNKSPYSYM